MPGRKVELLLRRLRKHLRSSAAIANSVRWSNQVRICNRRVLLEPGIQGTVPQTTCLRYFYEQFPASINGISLVPHLLFSCYKPAIIRRIPFVIVDTVNLQFLFVAVSQSPLTKSNETLAPLRANSYASRTVMLVIFRF